MTGITIRYAAKFGVVLLMAAYLKFRIIVRGLVLKQGQIPTIWVMPRYSIRARF